MDEFESLKEKFRSFVKIIDSNKNVAIIAHGNCPDGMASTVLLIELLKKMHPKMSFPVCMFLSYSLDMYGDSLIKKLESQGVGTLFVLDIGMNPQNALSFDNLSNHFSVCYVDHHPSEFIPSSPDCVIKTESLDCTTLMIYRFSQDLIDEKKWSWLVCAAAVSEFSYKKEANVQFLQRYYPKFSRNNLENSELFKLSNIFGSLIKYYKEDPLKALEIVQKRDLDTMRKRHKEISKDIENTISDFNKAESYYNDAIYFYEISPKFDIGSSVSTILSMKYLGKTIVIFSEYDLDPNKIKVSARNNIEPPPYSMKDLIEKGISGLSKATGGGHIPAAGGVILKRDIALFKKNVLEFVKSRLK